jgi:type VI secretion system protein ImpE
MNIAKACLETGNLKAAIEAVTQEIKASPMDSTRRIALFELLCLAGDLDRAEKQLDVLEQQRAPTDLSVQIYRNCLKAERGRRLFFSKGTQPYFLTPPPRYIEMHLDGVDRWRNGDVKEAAVLLGRAEEERAALAGVTSGEKFEDFRDCDDLTAPVLEVIVHDKYTWLPLEHVKTLQVKPPKQLRDFMWAPVQLQSVSGMTGELFAHSQYWGSHTHSNDLVRLGRRTEWEQPDENLCCGYGLRLFLMDGEDKSLFELGSIEFGDSSV